MHRHLHRCLLVFALFCGSNAYASSVLRLDLPSLTRQSEAVVLAEVTSSEVNVDEQGRPAKTRLRFRVERILAGAAAPTFDLDFIGGEANGLRWVVTDFEIPRIGERAIYFVRSTTVRSIVPFVGWNQGKFLVRRAADGREHVFSAQGLPVMRVDPMQKAQGISSGIAAGVITGRSEEAEQALDVDTFANAIRMLQEAGNASP